MEKFVKKHILCYEKMYEKNNIPQTAAMEKG